MLPQAVQLIQHFESCKLRAYSDQGGRVTIGWGSTGPDIQLGDTWTQAQADDRFNHDFLRVLDRVKALIRVPVTDNQLAALVSFSYNLGVHNLQRSGLLKKLNGYKYLEAAEQFLLWDHIGSYKVAGLTVRREAERALFLKP